jgi:PAS domain S-box-containing protein
MGNSYQEPPAAGMLMKSELLILFVETMSVYFLVLWVHSLRHRFGLAHFYALIGGITAVMSWVTDAGVKVQVAGITFMVGSTVFYTSLLLGVFVMYVFDGPRATRIAISTVAGVSIMVPLISIVLHLQMKNSGLAPLGYVPMPSLRINTASVAATIVDLVFLAMAWEYLGRPKLEIRLWLRAFLTLLGVMWLDVILFATGAFAGSPEYLDIMKGTLLSRFIISGFACPFLYLYLRWENKKLGIVIENRPVLSILKEVAEVRAELSQAQREIERRKQAEDALHESQARLDLALRSAHMGVWYWDLIEDRRYFDDQACRLLGIDPAAFTGAAAEFFRVVHPEDREKIKGALAQTIEQNVPYQAEYRVIWPDGNIHSITARGRLARDDHGRPMRINGIIWDITERKREEEERLRLEQRIQQAGKTESLGRMAGAIAHHFNNLLGAVMGNLELAVLDLPQGVKPRANIAQAMVASGRAAEISRLMLAYIGQTIGTRRPIDLSEACREALPLLTASLSKKVQLRTEFPERGPIIQADAVQIRQILTNLVVNAGEAMGDRKGEVVVTVRVMPATNVRASRFYPPKWEPEEKSYACLSVSDSGAGMDLETIEKAFDPFFSTKFTGRGLGLAVAMGVVKAHEGALTVESDPGRGTVFRVFLPL